MKNFSSSVAGGLAALFAGLAVCATAHAALSNDVDVSLIAPGGMVSDSTPLALTQVATLGAGITPGDGGAVGDFMLDGEQITFVGDTILVRVAAGWEHDNGQFVTGYLGLGGEHARYQLDNLNIAGRQIVGIGVYAFDGHGTSGNTGVASPANPATYVQLQTPHSLTFDLDGLVFTDRGNGGSNNYGEFRIDLLTSPVPEPAAALLTLAGLGMLALRRARQRVGRR